MIPACEIIAIGSELLGAARMDTNSLFLTERLSRLGISVVRKTIVGDSVDAIEKALRPAFQEMDVTILTGGLGPTEDDVSMEAASRALGQQLRLDEDTIRKIEKRFADRGLAMSESSRKQALSLVDAHVMPNPVGLAPGCWFERGEHIVILLPGVPAEMKALFDREVLPRLRKRYEGPGRWSRILKIAGLGESFVSEAVRPLRLELEGLTVGYLCSAGRVELHLATAPLPQEEGMLRLDEAEEKVRRTLGSNVYAVDDQSLEGVVAELLQREGGTVAVAESCTGGLLAHRLTNISGSSGYFLGGVVAYADRVKAEILGVETAVLAGNGAVSEPVALRMAEGVRRLCGARYGVGITGIAGPTGGTPEKPVGLVYISLADPRQTRVEKCSFRGAREEIKMQTTDRALNMLRRLLLSSAVETSEAAERK
jgi:nicotinamide-nucleotide amidase